MAKTRAQAWGLDLIVGFTLFMLGFTMFYFYSINSSSESDDLLATMSYQGNTATQLLLSEGNPSDWNLTNVLVPGLISDKKISQAKLDMFANLTYFDYQRCKSLLGLSFDYYLNFSIPMIINGSSVSGIGQIPANADNIFLSERVTVYQFQPVTMRMILWS